MSYNACGFKIASPKTIPLIELPWKEGDPIKQMPVPEFQKLIKSQYGESVVLDNSLREDSIKELQNRNWKRFSSHVEIVSYKKDVFRNVVLCNMGSFGFGAFARRRIQKGELVAIYSGTITSRDPKVDIPTNDEAIPLSDTLYLSTLKHRGVGSFLQHLPKAKKTATVRELIDRRIANRKVQHRPDENKILLEHELYRTKFEDDGIIDNIQTENVTPRFVFCNNILVVCLVAKRVIEAGEQLGYSYGQNYWFERGVPPCYFSKDGSCIPKKQYKIESGFIDLPGVNSGFQYDSIIKQINNRRAAMQFPLANGTVATFSSLEVLAALVKAHAVHIEMNVNESVITQGMVIDID